MPGTCVAERGFSPKACESIKPLELRDCHSSDLGKLYYGRNEGIKLQRIKPELNSRNGEMITATRDLTQDSIPWIVVRVFS